MSASRRASILASIPLPILKRKCSKQEKKRPPTPKSSPEEDNMLKPGTVIRPHIEPEEAQVLAERLFGLKVTKIDALNSFDDRNFKIMIKDGPVNEHIYLTGSEIKSGLQLKVSNKLDTRCPQLLESITRLMLHANECGIRAPRPLKSINGRYICKVKLRDESGQEATFAVRLFTFISGKLFKEAPYTDSLLFQLGVTAAKLTNAFRDYSDPILETRQTCWSLLSVPKLTQFLFAMQDPRRQNLIIETLSDFNEAMSSVNMEELQWGIIHGDLNEQNLLIDQSGRICDWRLSGIIDFGDAHRAPVIFELAILCAQIMLGCMSMDPLCAPAHIISGYETIRPLTDIEMKLLPILIQGRLAQCLVMGAYSYYQEPNNDYLLSSAKRGWPLLTKFRATPSAKMISMWNEAQLYCVNDDLDCYATIHHQS